MQISRILSGLIALLFVATFAQAGSITSAYTKLDFDEHCKIYKEYELGVSAKCSGYKDLPVYFDEGDLRQMVRFGHANPKTDRWQSFGEFNAAGTTIEWRIDQQTNDQQPFATILRWYIENSNPETGEQDNKHRGQVLVISTIANHNNPENACIVGFVDARANKNANVLARQVADSIAANFNCEIDKPKYHGIKGPLAGSPTFFEE